MIFLVGAFCVAHVLFCLTLAWKWKRISSPKRNDEQSTFSVVIPARNEEENIEQVIQDLENQDYPVDRYEIIVVDDFSTDATRQMVEKLAEESQVDLRLICLEDEEKQGKKHALTAGITSAKYDIILTTDADCRIGKNWVDAFNNAFQSSTQIVAGAVRLVGDGLFANMQKAEFAGLVAFGAVTLEDNNPSMCSGANLGFRKQAFLEVGGYSSNIKIPSGDDEFLLYDIVKNYPDSGCFLKDEEAIVETRVHQKIKSFLNQRARWTSKWKHNKNLNLRLTAILFFMDYLVFVAGWFMFANGSLNLTFMISVTLAHFLSNLILMKLLTVVVNHRSVLWSLFWLQIFYPFHVLFMGLISIFGRYTWKGRRY